MNGHSVATNTLLMPNVPALFFQNKTVISTIRQHFESFGDLYTFVVIKGFRRLMIVYNETASAAKARDCLDRRTLSWTTVDGSIVEDLSLDERAGCRRESPPAPVPGQQHESMLVRLYFGQHNPINPDPRLFQLQVPQSDKNFLISPPGSPFADWRQTTESPPNTAVLASDLSFTHPPEDDDLDNFRLESPMSTDDEMDDVDPQQQQQQQQQQRRAKRPSLTVIGCSGNNGADDSQVPMITVQDWDGDTTSSASGTVRQQQQQQQDTRTPRTGSAFPKAKVGPTPRPPVKT